MFLLWVESTSMTLPPIGVQPNIFREMTRESPGAVLDQLAAAGYDAVEIGPIPGHDIPSLLAARRLRACGPHGTLANNETVEDWLRFCEATGAHDVCCSGLHRWGELSVEDYLRGAEELNRRGDFLRRHEIHLHYHNHAFEFDRLAGDITGMDYLCQHLDPACVDLCVDVAWVARAGHDPLHFLQTHSRWIGYLHLKDFRPPDQWCPLGQGVVPLGPILEQIRHWPSLRWLVVEQDQPLHTPSDDLAASRAFLRTQLGF